MKLLLIYEILKNIVKDCIKYTKISYPRQLIEAPTVFSLNSKLCSYSLTFQAQREQFPQTAWICYAEIYEKMKEWETLRAVNCYLVPGLARTETRTRFL